MAKWIRNKYDEILSYESLMRAHKLSCKGKKLRREVILFSLKEEEYIKYLYEKLKSGTYVHGKYSAFKVYEPKERFIEKAPYIDRIVHRWIVDNFTPVFKSILYSLSFIECLSYIHTPNFVLFMFSLFSNFFVIVFIILLGIAKFIDSAENILIVLIKKYYIKY